MFCSRKSMAFYRGKESHSQEIELQSIVEKESSEASSTSNQHFCGRLQILKSPAFLRPFKCVGVIYILLQMSGIFIIASYSASFLEAWWHLCTYLLLNTIQLLKLNLGSRWWELGHPTSKASYYFGSIFPASINDSTFACNKGSKEDRFHGDRINRLFVTGHKYYLLPNDRYMFWKIATQS